MISRIKQYRNADKIWQAGCEAAWIAALGLLFMSSACIGKAKEFMQHPFLFSFVAVADLIFVVALLWGVRKRFPGRGLSVRKLLQNHIGVIVTLCFVLVSRLVQFETIPKWDALIYYRHLANGCDRFDFSARSFFDSFTMASHPTLGYAGISAIGEFLDPYGYKGVLVVWLLVTLLSAYCLYRIIESISPQNTWRYHTAAVCAVMSVPAVLGTFSYFQPDAGTVYFFIFVLYCYKFKKNILMIFSMLLLTQTKEVGIIILAGFGLGIFLFHLFYKNPEMNFRERFLSFFKEPVVAGGLLSFFLLLFWLLIFRKSGGEVWHYTGGSWEKGFRFDLSFMGYKCKEYFIMNFNWLIWGLLLICIVLLLKKRNKQNTIRNAESRDIMLAVFFPVLALMVFYMVYITYSLPRYQLLIDFGVCFLAVVLLGQAVQTTKGTGEKRCCFILFPMIALLMTEAYATIDPIFIRSFFSYDTGNSQLVSANHLFDGGWADFNVYNHQTSYLERAYEQILEDVGYHEDMDVVTWDYNAYDILLSWDLPRMWDTKKHRITFRAGENTIPITGMVNEQIEHNPEQCKGEILYLSPVQYGIEESYEESFLSEYHYRIRYKGFVEIPYGGKVRFMVCDHSSEGAKG